jgi:hypothetical protein
VSIKVLWTIGKFQELPEVVIEEKVKTLLETNVLAAFLTIDAQSDHNKWNEDEHSEKSGTFHQHSMGKVSLSRSGFCSKIRQEHHRGDSK